MKEPDVLQAAGPEQVIPDDFRIQGRRARAERKAEKGFTEVRTNLAIMSWIVRRFDSSNVGFDNFIEASGYQTLLNMPEARLYTPAEAAGGEVIDVNKGNALTAFEQRVRATTDTLLKLSLRMDLAEATMALREDGVDPEAVEAILRRTRTDFSKASREKSPRERQMGVVQALAKETDNGILRHARKYIAIWATLSAESGKPKGNLYAGNFDSLSPDRQLRTVKRVLFETDLMLTDKIGHSLDRYKELVIESGETYDQVEKYVLNISTKFHLASRSQRLLIAHEADGLVEDTLLDNFELYKSILGELSVTPDEVEDLMVLNIDFQYANGKGEQVAIAKKARTLAITKLEERFKSSYEAIKQTIQAAGQVLPVEILRFLRDEWRKSSLAEKLALVKAPQEDLGETTS